MQFVSLFFCFFDGVCFLVISEDSVFLLVSHCSPGLLYFVFLLSCA